SHQFTPGIDPRGAYGVVGIHVADLLPQHAGDEVIVATLSGDVFVLDETLSTVHWRTHVPGGIGAYNSIRVENLNPNGDNLKELYIAGSYGLWRFYQPGETNLIP
ncbi:MAG: hypothetical protein ABIP94_11485, partial [Planctomycetota bacterium]